MRSLVWCAACACVLGEACWAGRCITAADPRVLREYESYVAAAERGMSGRFDSGELSWVPARVSREAERLLDSGRLVRGNISDAALNRRIAVQNGAVLHWIGAIRIRGGGLAHLKSVLEDYNLYHRFYGPLVADCVAKGDGPEPRSVYDVVLELRSKFRYASVFPQYYSFRVKARANHSSTKTGGASGLRVHLGATEIRESESGVPGRLDLLEPYRDHGIMWALNAYWRARESPSGLYLEFETITLARSVSSFECKLGFIPVPKSIISSAMDSLPSESVKTILEGTRAECERRAQVSKLKASGQ